MQGSPIRVTVQIFLGLTVYLKFALCRKHKLKISVAVYSYDWITYRHRFFLPESHKLDAISTSGRVVEFVQSIEVEIFLTFWKAVWGCSIVDTVFASYVIRSVNDESSIAGKFVINAMLSVISQYNAICEFRVQRHAS